MVYDLKDHSLELCREFRKNPTKAEACLWEILRTKRLDGFKFRRQHPMGDYILDFYCPELKLAIEVDGQVHMDEEQKIYNQERTNNLKENGISVIRFWNSEVQNDISSVVNRIRTFITAHKVDI